MNEPVIDTSVIIALAKDERIDEISVSLIDGGVMSTVNVSEIYAKLLDLKISPTRVEPLLRTLDRIEPLSLKQARIAASLRESTRHAGLSLGDRCCLALAIDIEGTAYTTEHAWGRIQISCDIRLLR